MFRGSTSRLILIGLGTLIAADLLRSMLERIEAPSSRPAVRAPRSSAEEPLSLQYARALQPGRGREAQAPWQIPRAGWGDILRRTWQQIDEDRLLATAAGVVFYALLALFPSVTALVSIYGLFASQADLSNHLSFAATVMPSGTYSIVKDQIARVAAKGSGTLGIAFTVGLLLAFWSANSGTKAIIDALNVVYEETEKRSFLRLNLVALAFTLGAIAATLCAVGAVMLLPPVLTAIGLGPQADLALRIGRWPLMGGAMLLGLAVLYRYGPSRREPRWQWISVGAVLATALWLVASLLLSLYLTQFADYDATYGSLAGIMATMMWLWMSAIAVLLGAELNSEVEHQTARDSTSGGAKPMGTRGAVMADTVGEGGR